MRGTFANIRLRNRLGGAAALPEGGWTRYLGAGESEQMPIYDAAMRYMQQGTDLIVLAGREYGSGSSRDWAAKGTKLLGVRAVIAQSFERIHRSNLVGMGVLPLQFADGQSAESLGLSGEESFSITGLAEAMADGGAPPGELQRERDARGPRAGPLPGAGAHRHAARGRVLPPRRHPALRPASPARGMTEPRAKRTRSKGAGLLGASGTGATRVLLELLAARGPSGYETAPAAVWREAAGAFATVSTDVLGTPLALVAPAHGDQRSARRLLVMGHIDEIGLIVTHIDDEGFLWFRDVGGWDAQILVGQRVVLDTARRARQRRRRQEADPPAARRRAQEGRRAARAAHRHRRARRQTGAQDGARRRRRRDRRRPRRAAKRPAHLACAGQPSRIVRRARGRPSRRGGRRRRVGARLRGRGAGGDHLRRLAHERVLAAARRGDRDRRHARHRRAGHRRQGGRQARARLRPRHHARLDAQRRRLRAAARGRRQARRSRSPSRPPAGRPAPTPTPCTSAAAASPRGSCRSRSATCTRPSSSSSSRTCTPARG